MKGSVLYLVVACLLGQCLGADVNVTISSDSINSAGRVYTNGGFLQYSSQLPGNATTGMLKTLLPKAYNACPDCPLYFSAKATSPPFVIITGSGATAKADSALFNLSAISPSSSKVDLLTLSANLTFGLNFSHNPASSGGYLKANISVLSLTLDIVSSNIGDVSAAISLVTSLVDAFVKDVLIPYFNKNFPGIPLPSVSGFSADDVLISTASNHIGVSLDLNVGNISSKHASRELLVSRTQDYRAPPPGFSGPGFSVSVGGDGLSKVISALVPLIEKEVNGLQIPAMSGKASGISYNTDAITLSGFSIGNAAIAFQQDKGLVLSLSGLSLTIPSTHFKISKRILFELHCSGHFSGSISGTSVAESINVTAIEPAGTPHISPSSSWSWSDLNVDVRMDHEICKIIKDIASWFVGVSALCFVLAFCYERTSFISHCFISTEHQQQN